MLLMTSCQVFRCFGVSVLGCHYKSHWKSLSHLLHAFSRRIAYIYEHKLFKFCIYIDIYVCICKYWTNLTWAASKFACGKECFSQQVINIECELWSCGNWWLVRLCHFYYSRKYENTENVKIHKIQINIEKELEKIEGCTWSANRK